MNPQTFETIELPGDLLEGSTDYLIENLAVEVIFVEDNPVTVELPASVDLKITEAAEGLRGDTANNPTKPATLETGVVVQVPLFIKPDETVRIDTSTGKYLGRRLIRHPSPRHPAQRRPWQPRKAAPANAPRNGPMARGNRWRGGGLRAAEPPE